MLYFQPKVDFNRCTVEGFEALIRWNHPDDGLLLPCRFLDHIEYTEYASQVGRFVLGEAIKRLLYFDEQGLSYSISVNLSPSYSMPSLCLLTTRWNGPGISAGRQCKGLAKA